MRCTVSVSGLSLIFICTWLFASAGCSRDPYCLGCEDGDSGQDAGASSDGDSDSDSDGDSDGDGGCSPDAAEICNGRDDDCDGETDEDFDLSRDPENCGECGNECSYPGGIPACDAGHCVMKDCEIYYQDLDGKEANGCEYYCRPTDLYDYCNGRYAPGTTPGDGGPADDNCNGSFDEDADLDNDPENCGECGLVCSFVHGTSLCVEGECELAACTGPWRDADGNDSNGCECRVKGDEVCNGKDDDCDGDTDELWPVGESCCIGTGECRRCDGTLKCSTSGSSVVCTGVTVVNPSEVPEVSCDGVDNDCNGTVDDIHDITLNPYIVKMPFSEPAYVFSYEASWPGSTGKSQGLKGTYACSQPDVLPADSITWHEARRACCYWNRAMPDSGLPDAGPDAGPCIVTDEEIISGSVTRPVGWDLCLEEDWEYVCANGLPDSPAPPHDFPYGNDYDDGICNGAGYDAGVIPAGTLGSCVSMWPDAGGIYDLSGNVKEWTASYRTTLYEPVFDADGGLVAEIPRHYISARGGGYSNAYDGLSCTFDSALYPSDAWYSDLGFRCCYYPPP